MSLFIFKRIFKYEQSRKDGLRDTNIVTMFHRTLVHFGFKLDFQEFVTHVKLLDGENVFCIFL